MRRAVARVRPDVVVSFLNYTNIFTLLACRGYNVPVVVSGRLDPRVIGLGPFWSALRRLTYRGAACLVAQTPAPGRVYGPLVGGRMRVIPNRMPAPPPDLAVSDGPEPDRPAIMAVGRLQPQKDYDTALRAMAILMDHHPRWRMVVLGDGPLLTPLESPRNALGLEKHVYFAGQVSAPAAWLRRAHIFMMSSGSEGFPNVLCEAMALGLPCISTDCPSGPADIITPNVDGLLGPPGDSAALTDGLRRLIEDAGERSRLAGRAPAAVARFAVPSVAAEWEDLLAAIARSHSTATKPGRPEPRTITGLKVLVLTAMYASEKNPTAGTFVQEQPSRSDAPAWTSK